VNTHPVPATLDEWRAGWRLARTGNHYAKFNEDTYAVFQSRQGPTWSASIGRSFLTRTWLDPDAAVVGLFEYVSSLTPAALHALHAGTAPPAAEPAPRRLATFPRGADAELRVDLASYHSARQWSSSTTLPGPPGRTCSSPIVWPRQAGGSYRRRTKRSRGAER
jgi:hypothetical protein